MKRFFVFAAMMLGLASCQNETNIFGVNVNTNEKAVEVTVTAVAPEVVTRVGEYTDSALSGIHNTVLDTHDLRFILEVYDATGYNKSKERYYAKPVENEIRRAIFNPRLVPGREYRFVVWADFVAKGSTTDLYYNTKELKEITIVDDKWTAMVEARDAYTGVTKQVIETSGENASVNVRLTRPFGKLRVITTDVSTMSDFVITPTYAKVTYTGVPKYSFNAVKQEYTKTGNEAKVHSVAGAANEAFTIVSYGSNTTEKMAVYTDYFFAPEGSVVLGTFTMDVYDQNNAKIGDTVEFPTDIPVKRNILTTVEGNLLTTNTEFTVTATVFDDFDGEIDEDGNPFI